MAVANNTYLRWKVRAQQYLQEIINVIDFRLVEGDAVPIEEMAEDLRSHWGTWIRSQQADDLVVVEYELAAYHRVEDIPGATENDPVKIKHWFGETHLIPGGTDAGALTAVPLPTFVAVSAQKKRSGLATALTEAAGQSPNQMLDTPMRGGIRIAGITENQTKDAQGNELATVAGSNWLSSWQASLNEFVAPQFRVGVGALYRLRMQIRSDYGPGGVARVTGGSARIFFCDVGSIAVNPFVGSQVTRKQRKRFQ